MAYATRVFCRDSAVPSLSELLVWLRQHETPVTVVGGGSGDDLLSPFWNKVQISYDETELPLLVACFRQDAHGGHRLRAELDDFAADIGELAPSPARERVLDQLAATRTLVLVEFPTQEIPQRGFQTNGWLMSLFVERAGGMVQCDGIGFYDEDDDILLPLA